MIQEISLFQKYFPASKRIRPTSTERVFQMKQYFMCMAQLVERPVCRKVNILMLLIMSVVH